MADEFSDNAEGLQSPATSAEAVDISSTDHTFSNTTRGIYVGGTGNMIVTMADGQEVTFATIPAGTLLPIRAASVTKTGTTATTMVGLW